MRVRAVACLALFLSVAASFAAEQEAALKAVGLPENAPQLLEFFRRRTDPAPESRQLQTWIQQLGHGTESQRQQATVALLGVGVMAVAQLRQAANDPDERPTAERARRCLEAIGDPAIPGEAARALAQLKPPGAAAVLLRYVPFAENETLIEEIQAALVILAGHADLADKALLAALQDPLPVRRAVAAAALCAADSPTPLDPILPLLRDPKPTVRLRAALALAQRHESAAIPVLIELLSHLPLPQGRLAEEFLRQLAGERAPDVMLGSDPATQATTVAAWTAWWQASDGLSLLEFFRKRALSAERRERIQSLVRQLGDDTFEVRERATTTLVLLGTTAAPLLRIAAQSKDVEVADRARRCLARLDQDKHALRPATAARLLALRKPVGSTAALLAYLPLAEDDHAADAMQEALNSLARSEPGAETVLKQALSDKAAERRSAAGIALGQLLKATPSSSARDVLVEHMARDPDPTVRLRLAVTLAEQREPDAIPVLIDLVRTLPATQSWEAVEILHTLAAEQAPILSRQAPAGERSKAWADWWRSHRSQVDLGRLEGRHRLLGYTLLVQIGPNGSNGQVSEIGLGGQVRWQIGTLRYPVDARVLPGNRVLVAEHYGQRVSERDFKGTVLWQKTVTMPVNCQRLANGNTFIATRNLLLEVDPQEKEVFSFSRPGHDIVAARKLPGGDMVYVTANGVCARLDASGKPVKNFALLPCQAGSLEVLPTGHVLVPQYALDKVVEFDSDGRVVWEARVPAPSAATRLRNGHTLVGTGTSRRVLELDRTGTIVWQQRTEGQLWCARRR
jgi:HEAT repeat protein